MTGMFGRNAPDNLALALARGLRLYFRTTPWPALILVPLEAPCCSVAIEGPTTSRHVEIKKDILIYKRPNPPRAPITLTLATRYEFWENDVAFNAFLRDVLQTGKSERAFEAIDQAADIYEDLLRRPVRLRLGPDGETFTPGLRPPDPPHLKTLRPRQLWICPKRLEVSP
ncbi:hypothetical protein CKO28_01565 [Rhodovibrio sodomensis]|uniref:Uncharacterized protein n=1 Tax=Rhodovibrio sodomensis TaxID=1088 RepID=A0ABS1D8H7_9PROT|nr:hypothetical protein [Rhodovibrio sodomensis]MBK1666733.1 hypothetical protein [Rhodovibrio sodomensis]